MRSKPVEGINWHELRMSDVFDFSKELKRGLAEGLYSTLYLTGHSVRLVLWDGTPLPSPPLYLDHFSLYPQAHPGGGSSASLVHASGDSQCVLNSGGLNCLSTDLLHFGGGIPIPGPLDLELRVNDLRAPLENDKGGVFGFYLEVGLRVSWIPRRPLGWLGASAPAPMQLHDAPGLKQRGYFTPARGTSVMWFSAPMQSAGRMLAVDLHTHHAWFNQAWVFSGTPEQLGLSKFHIPPQKPWLVFLPENHGILLEDVKIHILNSFNKLRRVNATNHDEVVLRCIIDPRLEHVHQQGMQRSQSRSDWDESGFEHIRPHLKRKWETTAPNRRVAWKKGWRLDYNWDRHGIHTCFGNWDFKQGDPFTVVAFNSPQCKHGCEDVWEDHPDGVTQHTILRGLFEHPKSQAGDSLDSWFVFPTQNTSSYLVNEPSDAEIIVALMEGGLPASKRPNRFHNLIKMLANFFGRRFDPFDNELMRSIPSWMHYLVGPCSTSSQC